MVAGRPSYGYQSLIALLAALMLNSLLASLSAFWKLDVAQSTLLYLAAGGVAVGWLIWRFPWASVIGILAGSVAGLAALNQGYLPRVALFLQALTQQVVEFGQNLQQFALEATFGPELGSAFLGTIALLGGLFILSEALSKGNTFWSIAVGTLVFGTQWAWYYDDAATYFTAFVVLAFLMWTLAQAARRDARWLSSGRKVGYKSHVVTPVVWVLVVALVALFLPTSFEPMDLGSLGERAQEAFPVLKRLRGAGVGVGGGRFSLRVTGFSPTMGALGGPVKLDHSVAILVTPDQPLKDTAYLRGATFQVYDGRTWTTGKPAEVEVPESGSLPTYFGADVLRDYADVEIKHAVNLGYTVFNLWEPMTVQGLKSGFQADVDGNLFANRLISKDSPYKVSARWPRYSSEQILKLQSTAVSDAYAPYLQLPATLPQRVRDRVHELTQDQDHPYKQALAIEAYLRSLPYKLDVPSPPSGRDFVDYFLFDLQEGYCVYSATAMAVMLRELGIPTRMVEGFALPLSARYTENASGKRTYSVLNSQAHAWVEAYFSGYGWVTFDPTPRSDLPLIDRSTPAPRTEETPSTSTPSTTPNDRDIPDPGLEETPEDFNTGGAGGSGRTPMAKELPWVLGALALIGGVVYLAYRKLKQQDRIASREGREAVQEVWFKAGALLRLFDAGPAPSQTATEYAESLGTRWPALKEPATGMAQEYTEARYSPPDHPIPEEAPSRARAFWEKVHEVLFERFGWRKYLWRRLKWRKGSIDQ